MYIHKLSSASEKVAHFIVPYFWNTGYFWIFFFLIHNIVLFHLNRLQLFLEL